jgi:hypothetical protein
MTAEGSPTYRTGIGTSTADAITLLGQDLAHDLIGKITFGDLAFRLVAKRQPTPQELTLFEAVLVSLADHGFTPTAIAARLTYTSAPESLQGALAAGLLGGGSRFLGVTEARPGSSRTGSPSRACPRTRPGGTSWRRPRPADEGGGSLRARPRPSGPPGRGSSHPRAVRWPASRARSGRT